MTLTDRIELELWRLINAEPVISAELVRHAARRVVAIRGDAPSAPVAWRVKDFADGWTYFRDEISARREAEATGALIQPLVPLEP
jgi:hypothetical protein